MLLQNSEKSLKFPVKKWVLNLKICLKFQISYYHPLNEWLVRGNQLQPWVNNDGSFKFWDYHPPKMGKHFKIKLKFQIPYYHQ